MFLIILEGLEVSFWLFTRPGLEYLKFLTMYFNDLPLLIVIKITICACQYIYFDLFVYHQVEVHCNPWCCWYLCADIWRCRWLCCLFFPLFNSNLCSSCCYEDYIWTMCCAIPSHKTFNHHQLVYRLTSYRKALTSKKASYWSLEGSSILSYGHTISTQLCRNQ